jgi:hypothetical protein
VEVESRKKHSQLGLWGLYASGAATKRPCTFRAATGSRCTCYIRPQHWSSQNGRPLSPFLPSFPAFLASSTPPPLHSLHVPSILCMLQCCALLRHSDQPRTLERRDECAQQARLRPMMAQPRKRRAARALWSARLGERNGWPDSSGWRDDPQLAWS